jgi:hypothetical protein
MANGFSSVDGSVNPKRHKLFGRARLPRDCGFNQRKLMNTRRFDELRLQARRAAIRAQVTARLTVGDRDVLS